MLAFQPGQKAEATLALLSAASGLFRHSTALPTMVGLIARRFVMPALATIFGRILPR